MIFFFDRAIGKSIPLALRELHLPEGIKIHDELYDDDIDDDVWLNPVGSKGWTIISQDVHFHANEAEWDALFRQQIGVFYLPGQKDHRWNTFKLLVRCYDLIVKLAATTPKPFIYQVHRNGRITPFKIPSGVQIRLAL